MANDEELAQSGKRPDRESPDGIANYEDEAISDFSEVDLDASEDEYVMG